MKAKATNGGCTVGKQFASLGILKVGIFISILMLFNNDAVSKRYLSKKQNTQLVIYTAINAFYRRQS